ncbi:MAG: methionine adenosyltransferase [Candidatus Bipolaricaulota bacterium]
MKGKYFTSESVTEGHPDKVADRISDGVLDEVLKEDPNGRVACETFVTTGLVLVGGEITTEAYVDIPGVARQAVKEVGYVKSEYGFNWEDCAVLTSIDEQSEDIFQGVSRAQEVRAREKVDNELEALGAGDQGIVYGYACNETEEKMPLPITLAHGLTRELSRVRKKERLPYLRPDGKSQVTIEYEGNQPVRAEAILLAAQHDEGVEQNQLRRDLTQEVVEPVVGEWLDDDTGIFVNSSGKFVKGGPPADTGMTGRKLIVDSYGGYGSHGGGAFSGKDPTKVDRSGSYMARYVAKNVVAAGLAQQCEIQVSYAIGKARPLAVTVNTFSTGVVDDIRLQDIVTEIFDFRPAAIIDKFALKEPIYSPLSCYGHFGREDLNPGWERVDRVEELRSQA